MIEWGKVDPSLLDPSFRKDVEAFLQSSPHRWWVSYGYRSLDEQASLYAKYQAGGPRAAPAGRSAHNYGLAVDVVLDASEKAGLQALWDTALPGWSWLKMKSIAHPRLRTGWRYSDFGHIEAVGWEQAAKARGY